MRRRPSVTGSRAGRAGSGERGDAAAGHARGAGLVPGDRASERLHAGFLRWQCRVRQIAMRGHDGRPTSGMTPLAFPAPASTRAAEPASGRGSALDSGLVPGPAPGGGPIARIVTVLCRRPEHSATMELRHLARRTHDPAERRGAALELLAERYFQAPREFSDTLTATFPPASETAAKLAAGRECRLDFEQHRQRYRVYCTVRRLSRNHPLREATFWHNLLFNPRLSADCIILGFEPDWPRSAADPPLP